MDVANASAAIDKVTAKLDMYRENVDQLHPIWFESCKTLADSCGVEEVLPRRVGRQANRDNTPGSPREFFKRTVTIPVLGK